MKNLSNYLVLALICVGMLVISSCSEEFERNNENEVTLTPSELLLKEQMADAAKIITKIVSDENVLDELVVSINSQPKIFEDRVKFSQMMEKSDLKSGKTNSLFKSAFESELTEGDLKSASTLIDELLKNDVEINIPYPIEDYPEGTDIVVVSHPLDNLDENIGYFVSTGQEVMVNMELTEIYPIIIVWPNTIATDSIANAKLQLDTNFSVSEYIEDEETQLKSAQKVSPTDYQSFTNWESDTHTHMIKIRAIYVKNDHRPIFGKDTEVFFYAGGISYNPTTKETTLNADGSGKDLATVSYFPTTVKPKMVRYAEKGYSKGWIQVGHQVIISDWHPAVKSNTFSGLAKISRNGGTVKVDIGLTAGVILSLIKPELAVISKLGKDIVTYSKDFNVNSAKEYGQVTLTRNAYKNLYNSEGTEWGEAGEKAFPISGFGHRPALQINSNLLYITTWEAFDN